MPGLIEHPVMEGVNYQRRRWNTMALTMVTMKIVAQFLNFTSKVVLMLVDNRVVLIWSKTPLT